ncbi:MAG: phosphoribosylformylglycinamidine synthase subunit PurQ, partial [Candidatus Zixiibacteriota bacterium]
LRVERNDTPFTVGSRVGDVLKIPIAHKDGNYYNFQMDLERLLKNRQVVFRYCDRDGNITPESNPNGSADNIAGIVNREGNVLGMMPHPERATESILGSSDGLSVFRSMQKSLTRGVNVERA